MKNNTKFTYKIASPLNGKAVALSEVQDEVFSNKVLGDGIAIIPSDGKILSPVDGVITTVAETLHAFGFRSDDGLDILVHFGQDSVKLRGEGFDVRVKEGDKVRKGQKLIRFDQKLLAEKGLDATTVFLLTNSDEYPDAQFVTGMKAEAGNTVVLKF